MKSRIVKLSNSRQFNEKSVPYMILAELVKITAAGEKTIKVDEVPSYKMAFEMLQDYILEDPDMDDYVVEKYEDYMTGRDIHGKEKEIRLLEKNGEIGERSVLFPADWALVSYRDRQFNNKKSEKEVEIEVIK